MKLASRWLKTVIPAACLLATTACGMSTTYSDGSTGLSASSAAPARRIPAMSIDVHKMIQRAQEAMDRKDFEQAKLILATMLERQRINDYERAVAWQLKAMVAFEEEDVPETIQAYEQILAFANSIPEALELNIIYGLSQLYYSRKDWNKALQYAQTWETRIDPSLVSVSHLHYLAGLHYMRGEYASTLAYIKRTVALAQNTNDSTVREYWYQMALSSYWELGQYEDVALTLEAMLARWPQPAYCSQLAGIRMELGDTREDALAKAQASSPVCSETQTTDLPTKVTDLPVATPPQTSNRSASTLPIVRVRPQYPRKAVEDHVEGYVVIELTIEPDGSVDPDSIIILEAEPKGYFEEAATRAASQFKYKPKIINGQPQRILGVKYRFSWDMAD